ncbi:MAG: hypothetical protein ACRCWQ_14045 [Bacilli bacterium]
MWPNPKYDETRNKFITLCTEYAEKYGYKLDDVSEHDITPNFFIAPMEKGEVYIKLILTYNGKYMAVIEDRDKLWERFSEEQRNEVRIATKNYTINLWEMFYWLPLNEGAEIFQPHYEILDPTFLYEPLDMEAFKRTKYYDAPPGNSYTEYCVERWETKTVGEVIFNYWD